MDAPSMLNHPVKETTLPLTLLNRGKVRDIYTIGEDKLLIVTTDRLSAFDVVLPDPIPQKGRVLNQTALFWFKRLEDIVPNHIITDDIYQMGLSSELLEKYASQIEGRSILVKRCKPLPIECVVRGYITGSGWKDYQKNGKVCGHALPKGLQQCQKLPQTLFTPSTKAEQGLHDENISIEQASELIGADLIKKVIDLSISIYEQGDRFANEKGIMIADTKFEFGILNNELVLIDEVLTPDSSRFWPKAKYEIGRDQDSFDKQIVRNYLQESGWDKTPPGPILPKDIISQTSQAYIDVYERLTGQKLS